MINILKKKKIKIRIIGFLFIFVLFFLGVKANNWLEWKMAADAAGMMSVQLGVTSVNITPCIPSCQTPAGIATCCIGGTMCPQYIPGVNGTYDIGCPIFSDVIGVQAGGMGNMALISNMAIAQAGLSSGGQFIYGGTTNNMSMMEPGVPNAVLASSGGCFNCINKVGFFNEIIEKFKFVIAGF